MQKMGLSSKSCKRFLGSRRLRTTRATPVAILINGERRVASVNDHAASVITTMP
jgi:hypothetical protein